jgi:protein gp37
MVIDQPNCFNNYLPRIHEQSETHAYQIQIRENSRGTVLVSSGKNGFHTPNTWKNENKIFLNSLTKHNIKE